QGDAAFAANVVSLERNGTLKTVRIFEFGADGFLSGQINAARARVIDGGWLMQDVERLSYDTRNSGSRARITTEHLPAFVWKTALTNEMVSVALLKPDRMSTID